MPIPEVEESGELSGLQRNSMIVPFKKRRFPTIPFESPQEEEVKASEDSESKNKQDSSGVNDRLSATIARNVESPTVEEAKSEVFASISSQQGNPCISLGLMDDTEKKVIVSLKEKVEGLEEASNGNMNVELSVGLKDSLGSAIEKQKDEDVDKSGNKSDPSMVSLSSCKETTVMHGNNNSIANQVDSELCSDRLSWDLNTTMDVWSGSTNSEALTSSFIENTEFSQIDDCRNSKSSLIVSSTAGLGLNQGSNVLDENRSKISITSRQPNRGHKLNLFTGFTFDMPCARTDSLKDHSATARKLFPSNDNAPNLSLQLCQQPAMTMNVIRPSSTVKAEPIDQSSELYPCIVSSSCSSSNLGLSKTNSVKNHSLETPKRFREGELIRNPSVVTALTSVGPQELVNCTAIKSELVQEANQESCRYKAIEAHKNDGRFTQLQQSCDSSSSIPFPLVPPESYRQAPSIFSEQTMDGDLLHRSEQNIHSKESKDPENALGRSVEAMVTEPSDRNGKQLMQCKIEKLICDDPHENVERINGHSLRLGESADIAADIKEKKGLLCENLQKTSYYSDCGPRENHVDPSTSKGRKMCAKADEYEDGEIRAGEGKKIDQNNLCDIRENSQLSVPHEFDKNAPLSENHDDHIDESPVTSQKLNAANKAVQKVSEDALNAGVDEGRSISTTVAEKQLDFPVNGDVEEKGVSNDLPSNESQGIVSELENNATDSFDADVSSRKNDCTSAAPEASPNCIDTAKDSIHTAAEESKNMTNRSRIINLPCSSSATTFDRAKFDSKRLLTSKSAKQREFNFDGEIFPRGRRYEGGVNRFAKDKFHDQPFRSARRNFRTGKGVIYEHNDWDSAQNFASEAYNRPHYERYKHTSSMPEFEREPYNSSMACDNSSFASHRQKTSNDSLPPFRRRRQPSPGDIDGSSTRETQKRRRIPRNINSDDCSSTFVGFRHADKFLRRLSSDNAAANPSYSSRTRPLRDEIEGQMSRGNRTFSPVERKGFPRMRSSDIVSRRRGSSPSYGAGNFSDLRENFHAKDDSCPNYSSRRPVRSFRQDDEDVQFPQNDGPRIYRYHRPEFVVERSHNNPREIREFDGQAKNHQISERVAYMDEQYDSREYSERVWREDEPPTERRRY